MKRKTEEKKTKNKAKETRILFLVWTETDEMKRRLKNKGYQPVLMRNRLISLMNSFGYYDVNTVLQHYIGFRAITNHFMPRAG